MKEEILAKSREENRNGDPYTIEVNRKATTINIFLIFIIATILFVTEIFANGSVNLGIWSMVTAANAGLTLYKGIKFKYKRMIVYGIIWALITAIFLFFAIDGIVNENIIYVM